MNEETFLELCRKSYGQSFIHVFELALSVSRKYLAGQKRLSGDSVFEHNIRTALILLENKASPELIIVAILHKILVYCPEKEIEENFGKDILNLIKGVDEVKHIKSKNEKLEADALRKILLTTLKDVRVIFVKLANKLDNLQSVEVLSKEEQKNIAEEVLEFYAPLANNLGLEKIKVSLEDLAFKVLKPQKYQEVANFLEESKEERAEEIAPFIELIKKAAAGKVEIIKIKGRTKQIYSIYKKIVERKVSFNQQYDLLGIRVIVPTEKDCYTLLGILHEKFEPLEERLKDYIANPKPNFYRSIHTGLRLPSGKTIEVQIRTEEMDEFAEQGLAAHWRYKGLKSDQFFEKKISWLKEVLDLQKEEGNKEFLETAKVDVFGDKIYCYTPKGNVKELPSGATILDFAYLVHEEVGNHTVGGKVNGRLVPLRHELKQGDVVEILTNKSQRPRRDWIKLVKSGKTRQKIRKLLKEYEKLPALHFRSLKPIAAEELGVLVESSEFPAAICVLAKCCCPLPGDRIVGIATKRRMISVHKDGCRAALKEEKRWITVNWKQTFNQKINFFIIAGERSGLLADLLNTIANASFEVKEAKAKFVGAGNAECSFLVVPRDLEHLIILIEKIKRIKGIKRIYFG